MITIMVIHLNVNGQCTPNLRTSPSILAGCEDFSVQFYDSTAVDLNCIPAARLWDFGDNSETTTAQNPVHVYTAGKNGDTTYLASLSILDQFGDWSKKSVSVTVYKKPIASFTLSKDTVCAFNESFCTNNTSETGVGYLFRWDFETGFSSNYDTCYTYDADGDYTVRLNVTDQQGCVNNASVEIAVNEIPNPAFTINPFSGCHPLNATFENTTNEGEFPITNWEWDFADYASSDLESPPSLTFPDPGLFVIKLSAVNSAGCVNTTENNFLVRETPTAEFSLSEKVCVNESANFSYTGTGTNGGQYNWYFEEANTEIKSGVGPQFNTWSEGGIFEVKLTVEENQCSDSLTQTIIINNLPEIELISDAEGDSVCELNTILFTALPDSFVNYQFTNFGIIYQDGPLNYFPIDTLLSPNEISVIAVDSNNCSSTASTSLEITVIEQPITTISSTINNDTICKGDVITINADGSFDSYAFYDEFLVLQNSNSSQFTSNQINPDNSIYAVATYLGCEGPPSNRISTVINTPLDIPQINCGESTTTSVTWVWESVEDALGYEINIDNGGFQSPNGPLTHLKSGMAFGDSAYAYIRAIGEDPCGNSLMSDTVLCIAIPCQEIGFDAPSIPNYCVGDTIILGIENIQTTTGDYTLTFNETLMSDSTTTFVGKSDTLIEVILTDNNQLGCPTFSVDFPFLVYPLPEFELFISADTICKKDELTISSDIAGYSNYLFKVNGDIIQDSSLHILTTSFNEDLNKTIALTTSEKGCQYTDSSSIYVVPTPPNELSLVSNTICEGEMAVFNGTPGYDHYEFSEVIGEDLVLKLDSTIETYSVLAQENNTIIVSLTAFNERGCASITAKDTAFITPIPVVIATIGNDSVCIGEPIRILSNSSGYESYELYENYHFVTANDSGKFELNQSSVDFNKSFKIRPIHKSCIGPFSNAVQPTTYDSIQSPIINCGKTGSGKITFVWDDIAGNEGYNIIFKNADDILFVNDINELNYTIEDLNSGDTVRASIQTKSSAPCGNSLFSSEIYCIMPCEEVAFSTREYQADLCEGDSITLSIGDLNTPIENVVIQWQEKGANKDTFTTYYDLDLGLNTITVSMSDSTQSHCPAAQKSFSFLVHPYPNVSLNGPSQICGDTSAMFSASPRNYDTYAFYDGFIKIQDSINPDVIDFDLENGHSYRVIATNKGCTDTSNSIKISVIDPLEIPDIYCGASGLDSINLRWDAVPNASGYEISLNDFPWTSPNGNYIHYVKNLSPGDSITFTVRALGEMPCGAGLRSEQITCIAQPCQYKNFSFPNDTTICKGDTLTIKAENALSKSERRAFSFDYGQTYQRDSILIVYPENTATYSLRMIDSTEMECPYIEKSVHISVHPVPEFKLNNSTSNNTICEGEVVIFTADSAGFDIYETYINDILVMDTNYFEFRTDSLGNGVQKIYMTTYDDVCFFTSDTQTINIISFPQLSLVSSDQDLEICEEDTVQFNANAGFDLYNFYSVYENDTTLLKSSADSVFISNSLVNNSTIYLEGINEDMCAKTTIDFDFTVHTLPQPTISNTANNNTICGLDTLVFTVLPDTLDDYQFYDGSTLVDFGGNSYTTDSLRVSNLIYAIVTEDGCSKTTDSIAINVKYTPTTTIGLDSHEICLGDTIKLWVSGGESKLWSTGATTDTIEIEPELNTVYWVTASTGDCSSPTDTFTIDIDDDIPSPDLGSDTTICINDSIELFANGGTYYQWYPEDSVSEAFSSETFVKPSISQYFTLKAQNKHCMRMDSIYINVDLCLNDLPGGIPNGVTPNNDGTNDSWDIPFIWYFENNYVKIFNRWSNLVYKKQNYQGDWKGTNQSGNPLPDGTYYYVLDLGNGREPYTGFIIVHR